jgi:hypothetical protein
MWTVLYDGVDVVRVGAPPNPGDVALLGVVFVLVYVRTKNSVGPIITYVLLAEEQTWVALALLNPSAYVVSLYMKVSWSLIALCVVVWRQVEGKLAGWSGLQPG